LETKGFCPLVMVFGGKKGTRERNRRKGGVRERAAGAGGERASPADCCLSRFPSGGGEKERKVGGELTWFGLLHFDSSKKSLGGRKTEAAGKPCSAL